MTVTLTAEALRVTFDPDDGLLGTSLTHRGDELLGPKGMPLLAPWANRLGDWRYEAGDVTVDLAGLDLRTDDNGLPIHGTMEGQSGWDVEQHHAAFTARLDFGARPELLRSFPFPHVLTVSAELDHRRLVVHTAVTASGDRPMPLTFGWHPYFLLPATERAAQRLRLPERRHLLLDQRGLPTGEVEEEGAEDEPLGARTYDDLFGLAEDRQLALIGGGRRLVVTCLEGYDYAQVYAPPGERFVCLEPMAAPTNALLTGDYRSAAPGSTATSIFSVAVEAV